jgi:hypothetical protein
MPFAAETAFAVLANIAAASRCTHTLSKLTMLSETITQPLASMMPAISNADDQVSYSQHRQLLLCDHSSQLPLGGACRWLGSCSAASMPGAVLC